MAENSEPFEDVSNPLDSVEDILASQNWEFDRPNPEQLSVMITGRLGTYSVNFLWQEDFSAMQFICAIDASIDESRRDLAARTLMTLNARLPLGHFTLQDGLPCFRHTSLFRGWTHTSGAEHVEDLVEIAIAECDRVHGVFQILSGDGAQDGLIDLALAEAAGEA